MFCQKKIKKLKCDYPHGTRIRLIRMGEDPRPVVSGMCGTVQSVDDVGTLHIIFDNGRLLGVIPGVDDFCIIPEKSIEKVLEGIDKDCDVFKVCPKRREAVEIYYNPDSFSGGQFVFNYYSAEQILEAEKYSAGNAKLFFEYLQDFCLQKSVDIDDAPETVEAAAQELMSDADFCGCTEETMTGLIKAAHRFEEEKYAVQSSLQNN